MYKIKVNNADIGIGFTELDRALETMREFRFASNLRTMSLCDESGVVLASRCASPIMCLIEKHAIGGVIGNERIYCGQEKLDVTGDVLNLNLEQIKSLKNDGAAVESLFSGRLKWGGPYEIRVSESICHYFGIWDMDELTEQNLSFVKAIHAPKKYIEIVVEVPVRVRMRVPSGADMYSLADILEVDCTSSVRDMDVLDAEIVVPEEGIFAVTCR